MPQAVSDFWVRRPHALYTWPQLEVRVSKQAWPKWSDTEAP
jgi:hypothetical protein